MLDVKGLFFEAAIFIGDFVFELSIGIFVIVTHIASVITQFVLLLAALAHAVEASQGMW